jgi:predicted secreted Zn-dependent protease
LHEENQNLRQRVENLEQIITSLDKDLLALRPHNNSQSLQQQIEEILKKLKS